MFAYARAGPTNFGPTAEAATPWVQLAMYTAMRAGPLSVVLVCGQRLWRLPPQLLSCTHCLIWPWDTEAVRAHVRLRIIECGNLEVCDPNAIQNLDVATHTGRCTHIVQSYL